MNTSVMRREVNVPVFLMVADAIEECGVDADRLLEGIGVHGGLATLRDREYVSWRVFATFMNELEGQEYDEPWEDVISERFIDAPLTKPLRALLQKVSDPVWIYVALNKGFGPNHFACLSGELERIDTCTVRVHMTNSSPDPTPCELFVATTQRLMEKMPAKFMGLEPSTGYYRVLDERRSCYHFNLPASKSIWSKARMLRQFLRGDETTRHELDVVEQQQRKVRERLEELNAQEILLTKRLEARARELERLNDELRASRDVARDENQAKTTYLANMSHEVRTPLNAIIGGTELVMEEMEDDGVDTYFEDMERINHAGRHLLRLIEHVLDLSKIEAGQMNLIPEVVVLESFIAQSVAPMELLARQDGTTIEVCIETGEGVLYADVLRLRQIVTNLLSNAMKFGKGRPITLTVRHDDQPGMICVDVTDRGVGMSEEVLSRVFRPFQQADERTHKSFGGTGLGLTISREFAELMGGSLTASSVEGEGATFTLTLPIDRDAEA